MAGAHIEREARTAQTGLVGAEVDAKILELHAKGWAQHKIARALGMTQPAIHYRLKKARGTPRVRSKYEMCEDCGRNWPASAVNADGFCPECQAPAV